MCQPHSAATEFTADNNPVAHSERASPIRAVR
jgi:hypothetical protein